jgi:hypothetical protein
MKKGERKRADDEEEEESGLCESIEFNTVSEEGSFLLLLLTYIHT